MGMNPNGGNRVPQWQWQRREAGEWVNDEMRAMPEPTTWRLMPSRMSTEPIRGLQQRLREYYTDDRVDAMAYGLNNASERFRAQAAELAENRVDPEGYWQSRFEQAEEAIARLRDLQATPRLWVDAPIEMQQVSPLRWEPVGDGEARGTDEFAARLRMWSTPQVAPRSAVFTVTDVNTETGTVTSQQTRPAFDDDWIRANYASDYRPERCSLNNAVNRCPACEAVREGAVRKYDEMYSVQPRETDQWFKKLARVWHNIALAHTAAYFMLEVNWNGDRFVNEKQLLAFAVAPDGAEGGDNR